MTSSIAIRERIINKDYIKSVCKINDNGCWEKIGVNGDGYGAFKINGIPIRAHRKSWQVFNGDIPKGLYVCHKCNNKRCLNPEHLYLGTHQQNTKDAYRDGLMNPHKGQRIQALNNKNKTHCKQGHEFTEENTYIGKTSGKRSCKICQCIWTREWRKRNA